MKKVFSLLLLLFVAANVASAQEAPQSRLFTPAQMHQDLDSMYAWINATHPNLYLQVKKEKADKVWEQARAQLKRPMTRVEFAKIVFPVTSQYKDGHTGLGFDFSDEEFQKYYEEGGRFFPLGVKVQEGQLYVTEVAKGQSIKPGASITKINGRKAEELVQEMLPYWPADNKPNQEATLSRLFGFTLWYLYGWGNDVEVEYSNYGERKKQVAQLQGVGEDTFFHYIGFGSRDYKLTIHEQESLAVLELFNFKPKMKELTAFLDSAFAVLQERNIQHLAIDLRRSGGGYSGVGAKVLQYVTDKPFDLTVAREQYRSLVLPSKSYNKGFYQNNMAAYDGKYVNNRYKSVAHPQQPEPLKNPELFYEGKIYLLTAPRTFSSSHMMAAAVKGYKLATVIGEATGNNNHFMGEVINFQLPNTGWWGMCSTAQYWAAGITEATKYKGVQPDVEVKQSIKDLAADKDTVLEYLKESIRTGKVAAAE
ncbi:S41 family peptidase [uncultured Pontibacter sp.]|uniref:S41 family peptidase n=1 Tax=uncultured Pontibacter sp. TaxID=453356 RepID=UPI0026104C53|nr:S41 family peptidase [uncultured Pontibacter sp.]